MLEDIAILTGGKVVSEELGRKLDSATMEDLGSAHQVVVTKDTTTIVGGNGDQEQIKERVQSIKKQIEECKSDYDKEKLQERLAKLGGGVAVIKVGSATEVEMKEKKLRIDDALAATRAAVSEGIVAGGGVALLRTIPDVQKLVNTLSGDEQLGAKIIEASLYSPIRQIAENAGVDASAVINNVLGNKNYSIGYDALTDTYVDMLSNGIIDPTKVTRSALQNAASVSSTLLTTECIITSEPQKEQPQNPTEIGM